MPHDRSQRGFAPLARLGPLGAVFCIAAGLAVIGGCTGKVADSARSATDPAAAMPAADSTSALAETTLYAFPTALPTPPEPVRNPDGTLSLTALEGFLAEALRLAGEGATDLAQDRLYTLQDAADEAAPDAADSTWLARRASLERRTALLAGILAEEAAFGGRGDPDSLLATRYGELGHFAFPDSLVPATGTRLPAIVADLLKYSNGAVDRWENYFTREGRSHFSVWLERKARVDSLVTAILADEELPRELVYLGLIESGYSPRAVSSAGAVGPWQFMAGTARTYGLTVDWWRDERRDVELATRAAAAYLRDLHDQFGDWALVLAAYNTGEGRIARKIRQHGHDNFWDLRLPEQTTAHIPKYIAAARIGEDPAAYEFLVPRVAPLAYDVVPVNDATDLELIARCAGVPTAEVLALNPALLRGASPPGVRGYPVRVPPGTAARASRELARVPEDKRLTWRSHRVARGETMSGIARRYGTTVTDIARLNKLGNVHLIRPGDQLLIPMPAELAEKAQSRAAEKGHYVPPAGYERVGYKVKKGDTLGGIARKLGVTVAHLRKVNNIHRTHLIYPGQRLFAYRPAS